jgi:hypothetical protein
MAESGIPSPAGAIVPSSGTTKSERYLAKLCKRSFLSLWSYPGVFRDQGQRGNKGDGKEVCDLLVVFENHIIIFSDKDCRFSDAPDLKVAWGRWFKRAVQQSAQQVWGAERWIRQFPKRLFLDRACRVPFPIDLPELDCAVFHRIVVAHDASRACKARLGGSGSLMIDTSVVGGDHLKMPFTIGQLNPAEGYVHVFDDTTLDIVMSTLDTISDFTWYLAKKESFLTGPKFVRAAGEEELLAIYLRQLNEDGEHDFVIPREHDYDLVVLQEGFWENFVQSPERQSQIQADEVSYSWDKLTEKFAGHAMSGTQYWTSGRSLNEQEIMFRFLAREPRIRRRMLAVAMHEVLKRSLTSNSAFDARVIQPSKPGDPYYIFVFLKRKPGVTDEQYRTVRRNLLFNYCSVVKLRFPDAMHIVGIATEAWLQPQRSEDMVYADVSEWSAEQQAEAQRIQDEIGLLSKIKPSRSRDYEYPVDHTGNPRMRTVISRNSPCPCGSRERYKNCHGAEEYHPKRKRKR